MTKLQLINKAARIFGIAPFTEEQAEKGGLEYSAFADAYNDALLNASNEYEWSFCEQVIVIDPDETGSEFADEGSVAGFAHSYTLPYGSSVLEVLALEDGSSDFRYRVIGEKLLCDHRKLTLIARTDDSIALYNSHIPLMFWDMVAYYMAYMASDILVNGDTTMKQKIISIYNSTLASLKDSDARNSQRRWEINNGF